MTDLTSYIPELLSFVQQAYPDWSDFSHSQFVVDELSYKRDAAVFAQQRLGRDELRSLLEHGDTAEFISRLKAVANKTNLLYMGTPRTGDLALINQPDSDVDAICRAVYDLLHGPGDAADRLGAFCDFTAANNLPQKWTFPTYYLFLLYPESEIFVKPGRTQWLSKFTQGAIPYNSTPSAEAYAAIRSGFHALREGLSAFGATDLIDVQSFVYVAHGETTKEETTDLFVAAVERLRPGVPALKESEYLAEVQRGRDKVYARYGHSFAPAQLPGLSAEEYQSFLRFENNRHWTGINRYGGRTVQDMPALRRALSILTDEERSLAERFDEATSGIVTGIGRAIATPILNVVNPESYGVWNSKVEAGLRALGIFPQLEGRRTIGQQYEAVNDVLLRLAEALEVDLWTLDNLWEWLWQQEGLTAIPEGDDDMISTNNGSIADTFQGFTADAFAFLRDLAANNNKAWMDANRDRWRDSVLEPMRALFTDLGKPAKRHFDPYLLPDELEITPTAHKVMARIYKNWGARPGSEYYDYYWGAFYRQSLSRQTDAQLFVTITPDYLRFGFYFGEQAKQLKSRFEERIRANGGAFFDLLERVGLIDSYDFIRTTPGDRWEMDPIRTPDDLSKWIEDGYFDVLNALSPAEVNAAGPALADTIFDTFRRVFPLYLWAVADEPEATVERYLAAEFAPDDEGIDPPHLPQPYTLNDFTRNTHLTHARAEELKAMLLDKKQAIFFGPPGTGKTYTARHLAKLLTGLAEPPPERLKVVQFHPAYGYEEFIEGIRPRSVEKDGQHLVDYPVLPGIFVKFCREAENIDGTCVFIIDEINRGNIPRIFGELMYLLEYRDEKVPLPYSGLPFRIPNNVIIIGTMNTADRSIALVDFALRRRFHFARFGADPDLFDRFLEAHQTHPSWLGGLYRALAKEAISDPDFAIGPSLFMRNDLNEEKVRQIWQWSVMPYLREYHLEKSDDAEKWAWDGPLVQGLRNHRPVEPSYTPLGGEDFDA